MTSGTLNMPIPFEVERLSSRRAYSTSRDMGSVRGRQITPDRELRRWRIRVRAGTRGDIYVVRSMWNTCRGALDFDWTPPDESALRVRFSGAPRFVHQNGQLKSAEFTLEEVL